MEIFDQFQTKVLKSETTSFTTFPQGFRISKNLGHPTLASGCKNMVKRYLKSEQTDKHTNTQTHRWTFRLIDSIGPEG